MLLDTQTFWINFWNGPFRTKQVQYFSFIVINLFSWVVHIVFVFVFFFWNNFFCIYYIVFKRILWRKMWACRINFITDPFEIFFRVWMNLYFLSNFGVCLVVFSYSFQIFLSHFWNLTIQVRTDLLAMMMMIRVSAGQLLYLMSLCPGTTY